MKTTAHKTLAAVALALSFALPGTTASAAVVSIDVDGIESWDALGDADNTIVLVDLSAALGGSASVTVDGIGWNVAIDTVGDSWLSEASVSLQNSAGDDLLILAPGIDDTLAGSGQYDSGGIVDLVGLGLDFELSDGILMLEFHESFDDIDGAIDALWNGSLEVRASLVPVPPAVALMLSGLGALGLGFRRRR